MGSPARSRLPAWVTDPAALESTYPRSRYIIGFGTCAGASAGDVMSRRQAENLALSDIASGVEVQIGEVTEEHDTYVIRNGRSSEQNVTYQQTQRMVTGMLSGAEVKEIVYDDRAQNWHAYAVLERARAGRGAREAIDQRLARVEAALKSPAKGPLQDFAAMSAMNPVLDEMDRLVTALAVFSPADKAAAVAPVRAARGEVTRRAAASRERLDVFVFVAGGPAAAGLAPEIERMLMTIGIRPAAAATDQELRISVGVESETQQGGARVFKASAGARYRLTERGEEIFAGELPAGESTAVRGAAADQAARKSVEKLQGLLVARLREEFTRLLGAAGGGGR